MAKKNNIHININEIISKHEREKKELNKKHEEEKEKIINEYEDIIKYRIKNIIDTMQTEFIYELAKQMDYWKLIEKEKKGLLTNEDENIKNSIKYRIEEIYSNIFKSIDNYSKLKDDKQVQKVYKLKKNKILKEFELKIKDSKE